MGYSFDSYELYSTAWKTASVSGAVTHMEYEELKDYTDVYDLQQDFLTVQSQGFSVGGKAGGGHARAEPRSNESPTRQAGRYPAGSSLEDPDDPETLENVSPV